MAKSLGKWTKHRILQKNIWLQPYLPETKLFTWNSFKYFLQKYGEAMIKPSLGSLGKRIHKVTKLSDNEFLVHGGTEQKKFKEMFETYQYVLQRVSKKKNIIQQVIPLAEKGGQPFDVRVMIQRFKHSTKWEVTGMAVKVAMNNYFITNAPKEIMEIEKGLELLPEHVEKENILKQLELLSLHIGNVLIHHYPKYTEMGIDFGIDKEGRIWIIEVNMKPMIAIFKVLRNEKYLEKIMHYRERNEIHS